MEQLHVSFREGELPTSLASGRARVTTFRKASLPVSSNELIDRSSTNTNRPAARRAIERHPEERAGHVGRRAIRRRTADPSASPQVPRSGET